MKNEIKIKINKHQTGRCGCRKTMNTTNRLCRACQVPGTKEAGALAMLRRQGGRRRPKQMRKKTEGMEKTIYKDGDYDLWLQQQANGGFSIFAVDFKETEIYYIDTYPAKELALDRCSTGKVFAY